MADVCFASDVVVLTSDNEGTPVSLIEAQAAGVPVVGTDVGGVRSVVLPDQTGLLARPDDRRGFAVAVARILDDRVLANRIARQGRRHARSFAVERLVKDLDGLYRHLLTRTAARA
jgi:glycosyltransferase involved in cell wall biosynthesis